MNSAQDYAFTRRAFLGRGLVLASAAVTVPQFIQRSAGAIAAPEGLGTSLAGVPQDRILVVIQLAGGNDGLNTVVPFRDDDYYRVRPGIGISGDNVLKLGSKGGGADVGLHPQMEGLKSLYDDGLVSIIQGVGYPNPNRSHFKSMDIWHTAETSATGNGWLGRYFDNECGGTPAAQSHIASSAMPGIAIGREAPLAMQGGRISPVSFESADLFRWLGNKADDSLAAEYDTLNRAGVVGGVESNTNTAFLMRTALDAQLSSDRIRKAVARKPLTPYPGGELSRQLEMISSMIHAELPTRVYYATLGGFDTHAGQGGAQGRHGQLMNQYASALAAFYRDLKDQGNDARVLTMTFSEFGRRVAQNASGGTDHGTAAPMFLAGPMVRPGVIGRHPSLTDLDGGDLKHTLDFRSVYAAVLQDWLKADSKVVLGKTYRPVKAIKTA